MVVDASICMLCGACASVCPLNLIEVSDTQMKVRDGCIYCNLCVKACPMGAIKIERKM